MLGPPRSLQRPLERGLDDLDAHAIVHHENFDDIESDGSSALPMFDEPLARQSTQSPLLVDADRLGGTTEKVRCPRLDLTDHHDVGSCNDEIDLTVTTSPVPCENLVSAIPVPSLCCVFTSTSETHPI